MKYPYIGRARYDKIRVLFTKRQSGRLLFDQDRKYPRQLGLYLSDYWNENAFEDEKDG